MMFTHEKFDRYVFEDVPKNTDLYVIADEWRKPYEIAMLKAFAGGEDETVGYVGFCVVRSIYPDSMELSWYPNISDRFHEVAVTLPRHEFVDCVGSWQSDEKPHLFVKHSWLEHLYLRHYSIFGLVDAIGAKEALRSGALAGSQLTCLRERIDALANRYPHVAFISFADSLLLKSNWTVGTFDSRLTYTYSPEGFIHLVADIEAVYVDVVGLKVYAILTQGINEFCGPSTLYISPSQNHICLNSFGLPFEQLMSIDRAAHHAIRSGLHRPAQLYLDEQFFRSLRFQFSFDRTTIGSAPYESKMSDVPRRYYCTSCHDTIANLQPELS